MWWQGLVSFSEESDDGRDVFNSIHGVRVAIYIHKFSLGVFLSRDPREGLWMIKVLKCVFRSFYFCKILKMRKKILWNPQIKKKFRLYTKRRFLQIKATFKSWKKDGREAPWKPNYINSKSSTTQTFLILSLQFVLWIHLISGTPTLTLTYILLLEPPILTLTYFLLLEPLSLPWHTFYS